MKLAFRIIVILLIVVVALTLLLIEYRQGLTRQTQTNTPDEMNKTHILGGFSVDTPERAMKATTDGIQVVFKYDDPPSENDRLGKELQSLHMKVIDGFISSYLYYYECHRSKTVKLPPSGYRQFCQVDEDPLLNNESVLLSTIATHLKQVKNDQLIVGYWVLDDWATWDAGSARQILIKIHDLIKQYTPERPAICGFGGNLSYWSDWVADNFSPQGCDMVGLYIYAPTLPDTTPVPSPDVYDWSMSAILPAMFASLSQRGWNIIKEPLIGIAQAFGGPIGHTDSYWITPTAKAIETQSRSFCENGATGLTFYGWDDSDFGPTTHTPMNSSEIEIGIRNGIAACKQYWSNHSA